MYGDAFLDAGFTLLPNWILEFQYFLELAPIDVNILAQMLYSKDYQDNLTSYEDVAGRIGISKSHLICRLAKMEEKGIISREKKINQMGISHIEISLDPLIKLIKAKFKVREYLEENAV